MFKQIIAKILEKETKLPKGEVDTLIETPPSSEFGDYSFPCFMLANPKNYDDMWKDVEKDFFTKKNPAEIASHLKDKIKNNLPKEIEKIETKGPYLNFFVSKELLAKEIININENFGRGKQNQKVLLEHTSVNPNASPHLGRIRNSVIGDSIYRILTFLGNKVERHYYVNDVSKQIAMLALVFKPTDKFEDLLKKYVDISKKIEKNPELEKKVFEMLHKFEHKDKQTTQLFKKIVDTAVQGQKKLFSEAGIEFDYFDYESKYLDESKHILEELKKTGKTFVDKENRLILDLKDTQLITKMKSPVIVLTRSDGTGLYITRDLAYTIEKCKKGKNTIVLGEDQKLYFEQLCETLKLLNKPCPEVIHYSFVLLQGIGKMSTRKGELVLLEEFLDAAEKKANQEIKKRKTKGDAKKVAIAAVKYSLLRNENNKNMTFNLEESLKFEGNTGPYLQYTYARASSILRKAKNKKQAVKIPKQLTNKEIELIVQISKFPDVVINTAKSMSPHLIATYSYELAKIFNEFYQNNKVIGSKEEQFRLKLIHSFRIVLKNSLYLLGIDVMEEM